MRQPPDNNVRYWTHICPTGRRLVWMAIPATGNSFRRHSLGGFNPNDYVKKIDYDRSEYDLIVFVRDPVQRFVSVWEWMAKKLVGTGLRFMDQDPTKVDKHLQPYYVLPIDGADYLGRFEALRKDWANLRERYSLGPFKQPPELRGTKPWNKVITKDQLKKVVEYYLPDFETYGYNSQQYLDATPSDANQLLRENMWR